MAALRLGVPEEVPMAIYTQYWVPKKMQPAHGRDSDSRSFSQYSHGDNPRVLP